jgi:hypothetical protein
MEKLEFKGTKGKWEMSHQPILSNGLYIQTVDKSHKNTFIGEVGGGLQSPQEIEANAKLIASAPDLLEALQDLTNSDLFSNIVHINARAGGKKQLVIAWEKAQKALEKALT